VDVKANRILPSAQWFEKDYNYLALLRREG